MSTYITLSEYHYLGNILDTWYIDEKLTHNQLDNTLNHVNIYQEIIAEIITLQAQKCPFKSYLFNDNVVLKLKPPIR